MSMNLNWKRMNIDKGISKKFVFWIDECCITIQTMASYMHIDENAIRDVIKQTGGNIYFLDPEDVAYFDTKEQASDAIVILKLMGKW